MKPYILIVLFSSILSFSAQAQMSDNDFFDKRTALIVKHSHHDTTFQALANEDSFTKEYWRWRIDQYLYAQYPEYQPVYDAYIQGKSFAEIYDLPEEALGSAWKAPKRLPSIPDGYFTGNLIGNTNTGWQKVIGIKVYITYQGHLTDPYVASYDIKTGKWDGPYKAGHSTLVSLQKRTISVPSRLTQKATKWPAVTFISSPAQARTNHQGFTIK